MNDFMTLPSGIIDELNINEMVCLKGGVSSDNTNNATGTCTGTNNGTGKCSGTNNASGLCGGTNNDNGRCDVSINNSSTACWGQIVKPPVNPPINPIYPE